MKTQRVSALVFLCFAVLWVGLCEAHHPASTASASARGRVQSHSFWLSGENIRPKSYVYAFSELSYLDESVGQLYTVSFGGQYQVLERLAVGLDVPILILDHNFRSNATRLGDVALSLRYSLLQGSTVAMALSSQWRFPTGSEANGLGRGVVSQNLGVWGTYQHRLGGWFLGVELDGNYASRFDPILQTSFGYFSKRFLRQRIQLSLQLVNSLYITSDVFESGSGKLFLKPQCLVFVDQRDRWVVSVSGGVSVYDYLSRKAGVGLSNTDNALLGDVLMSFDVGLSFQF